MRAEALKAQIAQLQAALDDQGRRRGALIAMLADELEHDQRAVTSGTPYNVSDCVWKRAQTTAADLAVAEDLRRRIAAVYRDLEIVKSAPRERARSSMLFGDPTQPARTASTTRVIEALPSIIAELRAGYR